MISTVDVGAQDLRGMAIAIMMSHCRSMVTRDGGPAEDRGAGTLSDSMSIMVRLDSRF